MTPLVGGIVAFVASIVTALWFDAQNGEDLSDAFDLGGGTMLLIAIVVAGFSAESLRQRIEDAGCRMLVTANEGVRGGRKRR